MTLWPQWSPAVLVGSILGTPPSYEPHSTGRVGELGRMAELPHVPVCNDSGNYYGFITILVILFNIISAIIGYNRELRNSHIASLGGWNMLLCTDHLRADRQQYDIRPATRISGTTTYSHVRSL